MSGFDYDESESNEQQATSPSKAKGGHLNLKGKLIDVLGTFGLILFYIVSIILIIAPLPILGFPQWVDLLIIFALLYFGVIGGIAELVLYIWALVVSLNQPIDTFSRMFFVCAAIYAITSIIPAAINIVLSIIQSVTERRA